MSKKLLSEAQVRRFMSLARIEPLQEMGGMQKYKDDDDPMEEADYKEDDAMSEMDHGRDDDPMEEADYKEDDDDMDADMDADGDSDVELDEELVERFMDAAKTIQELAEALGGAADEMADMMPDADDKPDMDMEMGDMDMGDDKEEGDAEDLLELALSEVNYEPSKEEVVNEVAKRVAKRIMEAKRAKQKLDRALGNTKK